jgi:hypothetical protein
MGKKSQMDEGLYTAETLINVLKQVPKDAIVCVADCHLVTREIEDKQVALTRCRKLVALRLGDFDHKRPIMNFTIGGVDAVCLFPDKSREVEVCKSSESPSESGVSSTENLTSAKDSTPSVGRTAQAKRTLLIRSSSRSRGTFHDFME